MKRKGVTNFVIACGIGVLASLVVLSLSTYFQIRLGIGPIGYFMRLTHHIEYTQTLTRLNSQAMNRSVTREMFTILPFSTFIGCVIAAFIFPRGGIWVALTTAIIYQLILFSGIIPISETIIIPFLINILIGLLVGFYLLMRYRKKAGGGLSS